MPESDDPFRTPGSPPSGGSVSPEEAAERQRLIEDIASDGAMSVNERQARLEALADEWGLSSGADSEPAVDPLEMQIFEALRMLAEGGHR